MDYFYSRPERIRGSSVTIEGEEFAHLVHVMRKHEGDEIRVVDGRGNAYDVTLGPLKKKAAAGTITAVYPHHNEPSLGVALAVAVLKNPSKFDFLVEKVTELGVTEIIPLRTERTIPFHAKADRWRKLAVAAMKQSCRSFLPEVRDLTTLEDLIGRVEQFDLKLLAHERAAEALPLPEVRRVRSAIILVGPEGGFSEEEVARCTAAGFLLFSLGERRLRTETAAIVAAAGLLVFPQPG
jgi:16S rRNA (uracil1498-N3)-methyltransferase